MQRKEQGQEIWAYLDRTAAPPATVSRQVIGLSLDALGRGLPAPHIVWRTVDTWDWPEEIKRDGGPHEVGDRLLVLPSWVPVPETDRIVLRLDGRFGFGSVGIHPTTYMCLAALERHLVGARDLCSMTVADIGCGAGILSVATALLGAKRVYAVDTKAAAVAGTLANLSANGLDEERVVVAHGSVSRLREMLPAPVDGLVCNIITKIIAPLIPRFAHVVRPGTWGVLSGIREEELSSLDEPLDAHGWKTVRVERRRGWCCIDTVKLDD